MSDTPKRSYSFTVYGTPRPAGSKRGFAIRKGGVLTGKIAMMDSSGEKGRNWRQDIKVAALDAMDDEDDPGEPITGAIILSVDFFFHRPKSHYRTGKYAQEPKFNAPMWHCQRPDTTKLIRALEDALTGIMWKDDAQVVIQRAVKIWSDDRSMAKVTVEEI